MARLDASSAAAQCGSTALPWTNWMFRATRSLVGCSSVVAATSCGSSPRRRSAPGHLRARHAAGVALPRAVVLRRNGGLSSFRRSSHLATVTGFIHPAPAGKEAPTERLLQSPSHAQPDLTPLRGRHRSTGARSRELPVTYGTSGTGHRFAGATHPLLIETSGTELASSAMFRNCAFSVRSLKTEQWNDHAKPSGGAWSSDEFYASGSR